MSYTPTNWQTGDIVSSEKLNKMEEGIANAHSEEYIVAETDEWLEENITQETGYVLDRSLQSANAAAPADIVGDIQEDVSDAKNAISQKAPLIINTASGNIAIFADGADGGKIRKIVGTIVPVQSGTGDPSPTNIRSISGWTQANIVVSPTSNAEDGVTLPINWQTEAGTIYGGTVTLNEDRSVDVVATMASLDLGSLGWSYHSSQNRFDYDTDFGCKKPPNNSTAVNLICSIYIKSDANDIQNNNIAVNTTGYLRVKDARYTTASAFKSAVSGQLVVYPLATPQTYHFDNIGQLYTYFGTNNVWIDTGAITECVYPADTKLYIDGLTAPDEDMIANANIASGKYFVVNNQLYLSTAAIAAGASIVPGTNCTATNLAEALNALNT